MIKAITKKTTTRKKNIKKKAVTLNEFRAWLEGVEELQPEDWSPTEDQWETIRQKIDMIMLEEIVVEKIVQSPMPMMNNPQQYTNPELPMVNAQQQNVEITDAAKQALAGGTPNVQMNGDKIKTPNIDTPGSYNSAFG